ncbi:MAG: SRPBCC domain-containing protein [Chitinophagaceae bacterium]
MQTLEISAGIQIAKLPHEVFEAIADPQHMSNYFILQSSGRMEEGKDLVWRFPEFDMDVPVRVGKIEKDRYISFYWETEGHELLVEIRLEPATADTTVVRITEGKMEASEAGIAWLKGNTEGWANFLACLKAYLEFGINLRKGGFNYRKM